MLDFIKQALVITTCVVVGFGVIAGIVTFIYLRYFKDFIEHTVAMKYRFDVDDMFRTMDVIVANEIIIYERYLTNTTDMEIGTALTNAQFINIYNDLSKRVLNAIPKTFYGMAEIYMTENEIQTYLTQRIYSYLAEKVTTDIADVPDDEAEDEA